MLIKMTMKNWSSLLAREMRKREVVFTLCDHRCLLGTFKAVLLRRIEYDGTSRKRCVPTHIIVRRSFEP